jgi:hypothetical protein
MIGTRSKVCQAKAAYCARGAAELGSRIRSAAGWNAIAASPQRIRTDNGVPFASAHALYGLSKLAV